MERMDRRGDAQPRPLTLVPNFVETADGSCLITAGKTRVICTASVEEGVPPFLRGEGRILVRPSGTEALIRVMVEAKTESVAQLVAERLVKVIRSV